MRYRYSKFAAVVAALRRPDEGDWFYARRLRNRGALLTVLVPLLSTHPVLVTQIVDTKNADEWALVLGIFACAAVSYISRFGRRESRARQERGTDLPDSIITSVKRIRAALHTQSLSLVIIPLTLSTPWTVSQVVNRHNLDLWMCFFGVLAVVELWRSTRIWKEAARQVQDGLIELVGPLRSSRPAERYELELQLGRRMYARLERLELATPPGHQN